MAQLVCHSRPKVLLLCLSPLPGGPRERIRLHRSENQGESGKDFQEDYRAIFKAAPRATAGDPEEPNAFFVGMNVMVPSGRALVASRFRLAPAISLEYTGRPRSRRIHVLSSAFLSSACCCTRAPS